MDAKVCKKCKQLKPLSEYHPQPNAPDGLRYSCKICYAATTRAHYFRKIETYREARRQHYINNKDWYVERQRHVRKSEKGRARAKLRGAVKRGVVAKPLNCQTCGTPTDAPHLQAHHHDYSKPLDVTWQCPKCHGMTHAKHKPGVAA